MKLTQKQKGQLINLFSQALDVLADEPAPEPRVDASAMFAALKRAQNLPAATVQFLVGLENFFEAQGSLSDRQLDSLSATYARHCS